jgi:general secretion pathway protein A
MAGQPELADRLNQEDLRQLKQRIALRCRLEPLNVNETAAYIAARLRHAGGDPAAVFTREAIRIIFDRSRGLPRTINVICDNALITAFALTRTPVGADIINDVCRDFDFKAGIRREAPMPEPAPLDVNGDHAVAAATETPSGGGLSLLRGWMPRRRAS